jgi:predicted ester cyclase
MNRLHNHHDSAPANANTGSMQGFDTEFVDIVDYILRITYRIWEGKQIGLCYDYYSDDCPVYTLGGYVQGSEQVVQNTLNTLAAFPDRTLDADNIIWGGNAEEGYRTSHLINTKMTNVGDSEFGPATGKHGEIKVIAHCVIKDNKIIEEWLVRDNYSLAEQLGFSPAVLAAQFAQQLPEERFSQWMAAELVRVPATCHTKRAAMPDDQNSEALVLCALQNIWNARMLGDVFQVYSSDAQLNASANRELKGHDEIVQFYSSFLGAFSELRVSFDYSCQQANKDNGDDVAVRWTMAGKHTGRSLFGEPTNAPILVIGESQYTVVDGKIQTECTVFDQLAIMTQIERARQRQTLDADSTTPSKSDVS